MDGVVGRPQLFGGAIVVMLMIFATYNDILHLAAQWTAS